MRVCYHHGAQAVAGVLGSQSGQNQLTSIRFTGSQWWPDLFDVPELHYAWYQETEGDAGEALLVCEGEIGGSNQGILSSWLRTTNFGDCDCDDEVDVGDYPCFAACFTGPGGGVAPGCEPRDSEGDADVDMVDFATFQAALTGQ